MDDIKRRKNGTFIPGTKGNNGNRRKGTYCAKGHQGFLSRPVVILYPDGSHRVMPSVAQTVKYLGWANRGMVTRAASKGYVKDGVKLMYEEDWSPLGDYHFRANTQFRDRQGRATPEMMRYYRRLQEKNMTDEQRQKKKEQSRQIALKNLADPNNKFGKLRAKPLYCLTNNTVYASAKQASEILGIPTNQIYQSMRSGMKCHGYKFYYKEIWDRAAQKLNT